MLCLDHCIFSLQRAGGVSRWWLSHSLLMQQRLGSAVLNLGPYEHRNTIVAEHGGGVPPEWKTGRGKLSRVYWLTRVRPPEGATVFHSSYFRRPRPRRMRSVCTFHDNTLIGRSGPGGFFYDRLLRGCLEEADAIHCVSNTARRQLLESFPQLSASRMVVIHHGFEHQSDSDPLPGLTAVRPFALWVGKRLGYKNGKICYEALRQVRDLSLTLIGGEPLSVEEQDVIRRRGLEGRVRRFGSVTSKQLAWAYANAAVLWYPSLNEGFGFPVLEAASQGCPVLAAAGHGVEEIGGGWPIVTLRPTAEWLARETEKLLARAPGDRAASVEGGRRIAGRFTWAKYGEQMAALYRDLGL